MDQKRIWLLVGTLFGLMLIGLIGCQMFNQDGQTPTTPATSAVNIANYAQMKDGSTVVDAHQINWVVSEWSTMPYGVWMYVEINEQDAVGRPPGENQVPVTLGDVVLSFSGLPAAVSQIVIGVKAVHDPNDQTFTERGRFAVVNGSVSIPLDYGDLVSYFDVTHYSIWFQALGGENGQGAVCGQIAVSGVMPSGQTVTLSKRICFGTLGCVIQMGPGHTAVDIPAPNMLAPYTGAMPAYPLLAGAPGFECGAPPYIAIIANIHPGVTVTGDAYYTLDGGATWIWYDSNTVTGPVDGPVAWGCDVPPPDGIALCFPGSTP